MISLDIRIRYYGDPILRKKAEKIEEVSPKIIELSKRMLEAMYIDDGTGLAAPQIGVGKRLFLADFQDGEGVRTIINPEILEVSLERDSGEEGCLSIPEIYEKVERPVWIMVEYQDLNGEVQKETLKGFSARVFLHENDHLNGILFIDHLGLAKRRLLKKQLNEIMKKNTHPKGNQNAL